MFRECMESVIMSKSTTLLIVCFLVINKSWAADTALDDDPDTSRYIIEGRVFPPDPPFTPANWQANTILHLNGGEYLGFIKEDGTFAIHGVPSGSYVLEAINSDFMYEPVRVEINSKGKFRARKVNHIQTSQVIQVGYPLKMKSLGRHRYFQVREQWRITDFLFNPMILMMVLPLLLIMVLPKMMSDPETKKELDHFNSLTQYEMPEVSELVLSMFKKPAAPVKTKKRQ